MSRVLLISDVPRTRACVGLAGSLLGFEVETAASLTLAALALKRGGYDAAILDLRWGVLTAPSMLTWVKEFLVEKNVKVILCADTPLAQDIEVSVKLRSATFLSRHYDIQDLAEALEAPITGANACRAEARGADGIRGGGSAKAGRVAG